MKRGITSDAQCGSSDPAFISSLDQRQCFDRLILETFEEIDAKLNSNLEVVVSDSRHIICFLSIDEQLLEIVVCGPRTCGIPQGCPLATVPANLAAVAWHNTCLRIEADIPDVLFSYLDDTVAISSSCEKIPEIRDATIQFHSVFGPCSNMEKHNSGVASSNLRSQLKDPRTGSILTIPRVSNFQISWCRHCSKQDKRKHRPTG